ncbi:MAG: hypothetical protein IKB40_03965 [Paludibacteraceae bacterium]|nr:hypothetical protein [Paludibacteraceae bacterium]
MLQWSRSARVARSQLESNLAATENSQISYSSPEISKSLFLYQRYTKGIQMASAMEYGCPFTIYFS